MRTAEQIRERMREYRKSHREQRAAYNRKWRAENPDKVTAHNLKRPQQKRSWYIRNRRRAIDLSKKWTNENHEQYRQIQRFAQQKRRTLIYKSRTNLAAIKAFMAKSLANPEPVCYYCSTIIPNRKSIHFDHIIPLSKGGPHSVENLCVSCANCNWSKNDKTIQAWVKIGQQMLQL